ncbi:hypothetical protein OSB04_un000197 [Centaurea solstitialis]|uniref:Uncharacterized protein n=1 Tax=Centaurea solstitialis TaxID=347529 RepID=A0AA38SQZ3_9ASTR|nr:hypothetical protein OSB04_un000197 [Centaurea solstitialis]
MTGSKSVLINYREERGPAVTFGGNGKGQTRGYGTLTNGVTTFKRVAYVERAEPKRIPSAAVKLFNPEGNPNRVFWYSKDSGFD